MASLKPMAWGEEKCALCDAKVNGNGDLTCNCDLKMIYRKEPIAPLSALRACFEAKRHGDLGWRETVELFYHLSAEDRQHWEDRAALDHQRYENEKMEYNTALQLDDEILTDAEAEKDCECGNGLMDLRSELQRRRCEQTWARYRRDHTSFNHSIQPPAGSLGQEKFFHLFDLPQEIRDRIYRHYFGSPGTCRELRQWQLEYEGYGVEPEINFTDLKPLDTRILAVNHQVYAEALDILYSCRMHHFLVDISKASVLPLFIRLATGTEVPRPTSRIKQWHLCITFTNLSQVTRMKSQIQQLREVMGQCSKIERVKFTWTTVPNHWNEIPSLEEAYGEMLEIFKTLRGVGRVEFADHLDSKRHGHHLRGWDNIRLADWRVNNAVRDAMTSPR
ncbi:MAG: hypothetical protein Q9202_005616 [Teloschistes flavicans]